MKTSLYQKVHRDILLEWIYDDSNLITETFQILENKKDITRSYIGGDLSSNNISNQLFPVDIVKNKWAKVDTTLYNFLKVTDYPSQGPIVHDTVVLRFPVNYNFGEYQGIKIRVYSLDYFNKKIYDICNFYFDRNDTTQTGLIDSLEQPILYENRLWDKFINVQIPSIKFLSSQRNATSGVNKGSLNDLITNGSGFSNTSAIFVDFNFITGTQQIGNQKHFILNNPFSIEIPQSPELQEIQLFMEESTQGDYFEIYPTYNGSFDEYVNFVELSSKINKSYYNEYSITIFEQNIKGRTIKFIVDSDFTEKIEYRPIIKYSTTVASIDVEMRMIDRVSESVLTRRAIYGLKPNQLSKYLVNLKKIKVKDVQKPKIYVKKKVDLAQIDSLNKNPQQQVTVNVDVPSLIDLTGIHCYSENDSNPQSSSTLRNYHPLGRVKIVIKPFDNIIKFSLARKKDNKLQFLDLTNCQILNLTFMSSKTSYSFSLYSQFNNLSTGSISFLIPQSAYGDLKNMYLDRNNLFYITTTNNNVKTLIYSGLFIPSDSQEAQSTTPQSIGDLAVFLENSGLLEDAIAVRKLNTGTASFNVVGNGIQ